MTKMQKKYNEAKVVFPTNNARKIKYPHEQKMNVDTGLTCFTKINS